MDWLGSAAMEAVLNALPDRTSGSGQALWGNPDERAAHSRGHRWGWVGNNDGNGGLWVCGQCGAALPDGMEYINGCGCLACGACRLTSGV